MKKYVYTIGTAALALTMSGLPAVALAEKNSEGSQEGAKVEVRTQGLTAAQVSVTAVRGEESQKQAETSREEQKQNSETSREEQKSQLGTSSSTRPAIQGGEREDDFDLEENEDGEQASSGDDLMQKIEVRKQELVREVASSTLDRQSLVENTNPVRLAVHSLLASRDLLDVKSGIGQQVSDIAKEVNQSVASTTAAEAKIQARGFLSRLFFGGDTSSAEVITQEATQNQSRIDSLTTLLEQASTTDAVKVALREQIVALKDAQTRLQELATKEKSAWGIFSWRF